MNSTNRRTRLATEVSVPELPEVETVVRDLRSPLVGRTFISLHVSKLPLRRRWLARWKKVLVGRRVESAERRGKWIVLSLDQAHFLVVHLGMSGTLRVYPPAEPREAHTHLIFDLDGDVGQLRFRDPRRFGSATLLTSRAELMAFFEHTQLGPEPFDLSPAYWWERVQATGRCLKAVLLDQRVVAGVGNIYADESLFEARLHPALLGRETSPAEAERLRRAIVVVLQRAIERRGSSIRNYVGGSGLQGEYQKEFRVYQQTGESCPRCGTAIVSTRLAGRSTHYCPQCQPVK